jgi:hypothetical protein
VRPEGLGTFKILEHATFRAIIIIIAKTVFLANLLL